MNYTEDQKHHPGADHQLTESYLDGLLHGPCSSSVMDIKLARLKQLFAKRERHNAMFALVLSVILLAALLGLVYYWHQFPGAFTALGK
ncbi:hypothetical protein A0256_09925 [Mucilaginibacter sp. PAMC 26640]|nr:hypothetical protein A0256_09925 [Mucilaginibacter sp. PAMC 26640]